MLAHQQEMADFWAQYKAEFASEEARWGISSSQYNVFPLLHPAPLLPATQETFMFKGKKETLIKVNGKKILWWF